MPPPRCAAALNPGPLVSIIVRSRGRGGLLAALRSVAAQTWSRIEVVVVDTTGHPDSAWPTVDWRAEYAVRWLSSRQRLSDPRAANMALDAVRGDQFCFLDDDGEFDSRHIEDLVRAAAHHPDAPVVYARSRVAGTGSPGAVIGRPLNRALFFHDQLFALPAALIRRSVLDQCRFDETLEIGAEHDFLEQIALRGDFVFLANAPPSCTCTLPGHGAARAPGIAQRLYFDNLRFAKWTGERVHHGLRAALACARAERRFAAGDLVAARPLFEDVLTRYPGEPEALHGLARCDLAAGRSDSAWQRIAAAIEFDPSKAEYRDTAERIRSQLRTRADAVAVAPGGAHFRFRAAEPAPAAAPVRLAEPRLVPAETARSAPCPCGSGRRFKHCCGRLAVAEAQPAASGAADVIRRARELLAAGCASAAADQLARVAPAAIGDARVALDAGLAYEQMQLLQPAFAWFERAIELDGGSAESVDACDRCCQLMFRSTAWQSAGRSIGALLERLAAAAQATARAGDAQVHIVCKLDTIGGTEQRALNLYRSLAGSAPVTLWTTRPPAAAYGAAGAPRLITAADHPRGGTLVLIGTYFACGDWLESAPFERVVICHNLIEQYPSLTERLLQIGENPARPFVSLTFPSRLLRDTLRLPGEVEYSAVDLETFRRRAAPPAHRPRLVVGRHGRAYALKFHPNDPEFFRTLIARGYDVRILGGTPIAAAFGGAAGAAPELLDVDAEAPRDFLERLDVFVYRKHPRFFETGGTAILEAMAMELPVVVFAEQCGVAELLRDGENGILVGTESEAIEAIDRLARDRDLRLRLGRAARATVVELLRGQHERLIASYAPDPGVERTGAAKPRRRWFGWLPWPRAGARLDREAR